MVINTEPLIREDLIAWLCWNDPNGIYSDEDSIAEGMEPLTLKGALRLVLEQLKG